MSLEEAKLPSLKDKIRELSNEELQEEVDKLKDTEKVNKVEKPKAKKKK